MALNKNTNSFVSQAEATAYFTDRINSTWSQTAVDVQSEALVTASGILNTLPFVGYAVSSTQPLVFPRVGEFYNPSLNRTITFDSSSVEAPVQVKRATYELAIHLINNSTILNEGTTTIGASAGSLAINFIQKPNLLPATVKREINQMLNTNNTDGSLGRG